MKPSVPVAAAFSLALACSMAVAGDADPEPPVILDFGQVWQGAILEPCVYIKNSSPTSTTIKLVQPPSMNSRYFGNIELGPNEETILPLPQVNTRDFSGPITKSYLLLLDPPVPLRFDLLESCEGDSATQS